MLELLREENTLSVIASKYEVDPRTLGVWKKQFLSNASLAFEARVALSEYKEQIGKLERQNDELAKALGKATIERGLACGKARGLGLIK